MRGALLAALLAALALPAGAADLRWSSQGDFLTADPHAQNEGINNLIGYHVYERLVARDRQLAIVPSLATRWEQVNPTTWRFHLRKGVRFHDGTPFTADDVVFSIERAQLPSSNFKTFASLIGKPRRVDEHTVEIVTPGPSPILLEYVNAVMIMSRAWALKNGAARPQDFKNAEDTFASRNANGTGPFRFVSWEPEVRTVLRRNPQWWGVAEGRFEAESLAFHARVRQGYLAWAERFPERMRVVDATGTPEDIAGAVRLLVDACTPPKDRHA